MITRRHSKVVLVAVASSIALALAACGGGGDGGDAGGPLAGSDATPAAEVATVMGAIDLVDTTEFHDMAQDLASSEEINPRYAASVGKVLTAIGVATWPGGLSGDVDGFASQLATLKAALEAENLAASRAAAEAIHDAQHDFSQATYGWLGTLIGTLAGSDVPGQVATVLASIDIVDSAGFHDMAEDLASSEEISPPYAGRVGNVITVLGVAAWPAALSDDVTAFASLLETLKAALEAEDLAGARAAAEAIHDAQHDFSLGAYRWGESQAHGMGEAMMGPHHGDAMVAVHMKAVDLVDSAGFHDMAEDLAAASEVSPRYAGRVGNVITALDAATWPTDLSEGVATFTQQLRDLKSALEAEDLAAARAASEAIHDAQHDFSLAAYDWFGSLA